MSLLIGSAGLLWADRTHREAGYLWSAWIPGATSGYALTSDEIHLDTTGVQWVADELLGTVQLQVQPSDRSDDLFLGVARSADVAKYLSGVAHRQVGDVGQGGEAWLWFGPGVTSNQAGGPPADPPGDVNIWLAPSSGTGARTMSWPLVDGDWTVVVMRADGGAGVTASVRTGATASHVLSVAGVLAIVGMALLAWGARRVAQPMGSSEVSPSVPSAPDGQPTPNTVGPVVAPDVAAESRVTHLL